MADYFNRNQSRQIEERAAMSARYAKELAERKDALADLADRHARENGLACEYWAAPKPTLYADERVPAERGRCRDEVGGRERVH